MDRRFRPILLSLLTALMFALAGCADDGGGDDTGDDGDDGMTGSPTDTGTTSPSPSPSPGPGDDEEFQTVHIEGDVSGELDCQLVANGQSPVGGASESLPADAAGQSLSISGEPFGMDPLPAPPTATLCAYFDDGSDAMSASTVPEGATEIMLYADGAPTPTGISYNITIG